MSNCVIRSRSPRARLYRAGAVLVLDDTTNKTTTQESCKLSERSPRNQNRHIKYPEETYPSSLYRTTSQPFQKTNDYSTRTTTNVPPMGRPFDKMPHRGSLDFRFQLITAIDNAMKLEANS